MLPVERYRSFSAAIGSVQAEMLGDLGGHLRAHQ
jgi:hypothetical protein